MGYLYLFNGPDYNTGRGPTSNGKGEGSGTENEGKGKGRGIREKGRVR